MTYVKVVHSKCIQTFPLLILSAPSEMDVNVLAQLFDYFLSNLNILRSFVCNIQTQHIDDGIWQMYNLREMNTKIQLKIRNNLRNETHFVFAMAMNCSLESVTELNWSGKWNPNNDIATKTHMHWMNKKRTPIYMQWILPEFVAYCCTQVQLTVWQQKIFLTKPCERLSFYAFFASNEIPARAICNYNNGFGGQTETTKHKKFKTFLAENDNFMRKKIPRVLQSIVSFQYSI